MSAGGGADTRGTALDGLNAVLAGAVVWPHHIDTLRAVVDYFEPMPEVQAVLFGGSLAHGYGSAGADVDIVIVVDASEYARRAAEKTLTFFSIDLATYDGGYVDGKFVDMDFLRRVAADGSDAARWAFEGARVLFSRVDALDALLVEIVRYPTEASVERVRRFAAQLQAWRWFYGQGADKDNAYLMGLAVSKVVLFACRLVLAENEMLYPFHKWMLRVTAEAPRRPAELLTDIDALIAAPSRERVDALVRGVFEFYALDPALESRWGMWFMNDSELTWMSGAAPVDDL